MPGQIHRILEEYVNQIKKIYGIHLKSVILYGSYARGDFREDSDIDIIILVDLTNLEIEDYRHALSDITFGFNEEYNLAIRPIAKYEEHFKKWMPVYPFYANVHKEGVALYESA